MNNFNDRKLGRIIPRTADHLAKYSIREIVPPFTVENILEYPAEWIYDQNGYGACVGAALSGMMTYYNHHKYNFIWLWQESKRYDDLYETVFGDDNGTTAVGACRVLKKFGHTRYDDNKIRKEDGIKKYCWLSRIDQLRKAISDGNPIAFGINWYSSFNVPVMYPNKEEYWIGIDENLGEWLGGHEVWINGASDERQAFQIINSWGIKYGNKGKVWMPYKTAERLLNEYGDAMIVMDRP